MSALLDSSVLVAALVTDEPKHVESLELLLTGGNWVYAHAILEIFSTLTGGRLGVKIGAHLAARLLSETILPRVRFVELGGGDLMAALLEARMHGVRGGAVYDFMHLAAARKAGVEILYTLDLGHFQKLTREGDPVVRCP